jgi:subtilisin family serine protease
VLDDGVEVHEDLALRLLAGFDPRNPANPGSPVFNAESHGMACAGIIGASNNSLGIRGIASNALILPVRMLVNGFGYSSFEIAESINWAWDIGQADILSNSWGGGTPSQAITTALNNARTFGRNGRGCVVVFASGNNGSGVAFPGNQTGVITVGAINKNGNIWSYSSRGAEMDLVAPSGNVNQLGDIRTLDRMGVSGDDIGNYNSAFGGTSAACPQVAGVAALMLSTNPNLTEAQVRTILQNTATDMGPQGFDNTFGYGRLNAGAAMREVASQLIVGVTPIFVIPRLSLFKTYFLWAALSNGISAPSLG